MSPKKKYCCQFLESNISWAMFLCRAPPVTLWRSVCLSVGPSSFLSFLNIACTAKGRVQKKKMEISILRGGAGIFFLIFHTNYG